MKEIRRRRREMDMTQEELARRVGVTQSAVGKWETGDCAPTVAKLVAVADALGCTVDALIGKEGEADADKAHEV